MWEKFAIGKIPKLNLFVYISFSLPSDCENSGKIFYFTLTKGNSGLCSSLVNKITVSKNKHDWLLLSHGVGVEPLILWWYEGGQISTNKLFLIQNIFM